MEKNQLIRKDGTIYRILEIDGNDALLIDCIRQKMPKWKKTDILDGCTVCSEAEMHQETGAGCLDMDKLSAGYQQVCRQRYTIIAGVLPFLGDDRMRIEAITRISEQNGICKQTVRNYLCAYLTYQSVAALAPKERTAAKKELSEDDKNCRWALNKYYFTRHKNSLKTAYTYMLKEKYCDADGNLKEDYPSYNQFRYFYSRYKKMQTLYISRDGIKDYQRNHRPLLSTVQQYASHIGVGMIDATICDIYLVNEKGSLVGRPVLTIMTDAFSSGLVYGYSLTYEGGIYSVRNLLLNVLTDKAEHCRKFGIQISKGQWDVSEMPGTILSDMGSEYQSDTLSQITELGVTLVNLPPLRPELKSIVEKSFDMLQGSIKPSMMDHGYVDRDAGKRLAPDYRKNAALTLEEYEKVIIRAIIYHNSQRILEDYPYTAEMLAEGVKPHSSNIFDWGRTQPGADLIQISKRNLILALLPRITTRFTRKGLMAFGLRYDCKNGNFTEEYLKGADAVIAYNPDSADNIYYLKEGEYIEFQLIESQFAHKSFDEIRKMQAEQKELVRNAAQENLQGRIDLTSHIETIVKQKGDNRETNLKDIRETKKKARETLHKDFMQEVGKDGKAD